MKANTKILVIDDEPGILNLIKAYLVPEGYEVFTAADGISGLKAAHAHQPDVVILDIMLPGMDGLEMLDRLRKGSNVYVILLTAKTEEMDKILGLSIGADDYVTKPFSPRELVARVKSALRRLNGSEESGSKESKLSFERVNLDIASRVVTVDGRRIDLTATEYDLLKYLAENRGHALSRETVMEAIWGKAFFADTRVIDVHIGNLRRKLGVEGLIATLRGIGYRFEDKQK